jgi:hypothetical protein
MDYLVIFEDGTLLLMETVSAEDLAASNDGIITIVYLKDRTVHRGGTTWDPIKEYTAEKP